MSQFVNYQKLRIDLKNEQIIGNTVRNTFSSIQCAKLCVELFTNPYWICRFHFPLGNPATAPPSDLTRFSDEFRKHQNSAVNVDELGEVLKVIKILHKVVATYFYLGFFRLGQLYFSSLV